MRIRNEMLTGKYFTLEKRKGGITNFTATSLRKNSKWLTKANALRRADPSPELL
jgi:hypothetical protein